MNVSPVSELPTSFLRAAYALRSVSSDTRPSDWLPTTLTALRVLIRAAEEELGSVAGAAGIGQQIRTAEPRLAYALTRLEGDLAVALVALWRIKERMVRGEGRDDIGVLADTTLRTAERICDLLRESFVDPAASD